MSSPPRCPQSFLAFSSRPETRTSLIVLISQVGGPGPGSRKVWAQNLAEDGGRVSQNSLLPLPLCFSSFCLFSWQSEALISFSNCCCLLGSSLGQRRSTHRCLGDKPYLGIEDPARDSEARWLCLPPRPRGSRRHGPWWVLPVCVLQAPPSPVTLCTVWSVTLMVIMSLFCSGGPGTSAEPKHIFFVALANIPHHKCFISPAAGLLARRECPSPGVSLLRSFVSLMIMYSSSRFFPIFLDFWTPDVPVFLPKSLWGPQWEAGRLYPLTQPHPLATFLLLHSPDGWWLWIAPQHEGWHFQTYSLPRYQGTAPGVWW